MREPWWWYAADGTGGLMPRLLAPLGWAYGTLAARRMSEPPRLTARVPVVCIGNFTAGGTGKTPFVRVAVAALRAAGHTPVVLTRGYGGRITGTHLVDLRHDTARDVGDEALLLARDGLVVVARDRAAGALNIENAIAPNATVIVLDDGLQNPALAKDLTIAVIDGARGLGNGRCIPAGPLRAPLKAQLGKVDALLINRGGSNAASADALHSNFRGPVMSASVAASGDLAWLTGTPVIAYAGIGVPDRFFATIAAAGADLRDKIAFADHHAFTDADAERLLALVKSRGAQLVTTEKDYARLHRQRGALAELAAATRVLKIELVLDAASRRQFETLLAERVPVRR